MNIAFNTEKKAPKHQYTSYNLSTTNIFKIIKKTIKLKHLLSGSVSCQANKLLLLKKNVQHWPRFMVCDKRAQTQIAVLWHSVITLTGKPSNRTMALLSQIIKLGQCSAFVFNSNNCNM